MSAKPGFVRVAPSIAILSLCLAGSAGAGRGTLLSHVQNPPQALVTSPEDDAAVRALVESYYAAYGRRDLDAMIAAWHPSAPGVSALRVTLEHSFKSETFSFSNLAITGLNANVSGGTARIAIDVVATRVPTGAARQERWIRNQSFLQRDGVWKLWRDESAARDLGLKMASAQTDDEREALLATEPELANDDLLQAIEAGAVRRTISRDPAGAAGLYGFAERLARRTNNRPALARVLLSVGQFHQQQQDWPSALESFEQARGVFAALNDQPGLGRVFYSMGLLHQQRQDWPSALDSFQKACDVFAGLGEKPQLAVCEINIGSALYAQNQFLQALEHYQAAAALFEELNDETWLASTFHNLGNTFYLMGNLTRALESYGRCLPIQQKTGNAAGVASVQLAMGLVHKDQGDYSFALDAYRNSLEQYRRTGNRAGMVPALQGMAEVYRLQGYYDLGLQHAQRGLRVAEEIGDEQATALLLFDIGRISATERRWTDALGAYRKSLSLDEKAGRQASIARTLAAIGTVCFAQAKYDQALELFRRSLAIREKLDDRARIAWTLVHIGMTLEAQGNHGEALDTYERSLQISEATGNQAGAAIVLALIADVYLAREDTAKALEFAGRAARLATESLDLDTFAHARLTAGRAHRLRKNADQARSAIEDAITAVEKTLAADIDKPAEGFFGETLSPYVAMADLLIEQDRPWDALASIERARARLLRDILGNTASQIARGLSADERDEERRLSRELVSLATQISKEREREAPDQSRLNALELELARTRTARGLLQATFYAARPALKVQRGRADPVALDEAAAAVLAAGTALVEYVVTDQRVLVIALARVGKRPAGTKAQATLPDESAAPTVVARTIEIRAADLAVRIHAFRELVGQRKPEADQEAQTLYELLFKPVESCLAATSRLVIIPDSALWALPFEALQPVKGRFLIESHAVSYSASLSALTWATRLSRDRRAGTARAPSVLAFGNAIAGKTLSERFAQTRPEFNLDPMPEAGREVRLIAALYGPGKSLAYTAAGARKDRARSEAGGHTLLHAAVDGVLSDASPMYSELVFSPSPPGNDGSTTDDGAVAVAELLDWNMPLYQVVLSRLTSETGSQTTGEGAIGLSWALYVAGCPTAILSRWRAESPATPLLMLEFHRALRGGMATGPARPTSAEALRRATLRLMQNPRYRHPYFWAGFLVMGSGN